MEYDWFNPSWKRMEVKGKQEDYQSKLGRDMHSFHHSGGNGFNAHGWNNLGNENFTQTEHFEYGKEKESELENSEIVKENECSTEKQENEKEQQREKEIVKIENSSKDEGGNLLYKSIKTINFLCSNSYLSFEIYFKDIKVDECHFNIANYVSYVLRIEDKARNMERELGKFLKDFTHKWCFDILHDKHLGKFIENVGYVSSFLDTFMENHNDFVPLQQLMPFVSGQVELSCNEQKLSNLLIKGLIDLIQYLPKNTSFDEEPLLTILKFWHSNRKPKRI
ncbi:hypothetical protein M9H77_03071 [Catharanthus roseus]|uniref:Uncharacterized protein n=1 Tax=Catharanthus roseus TaxID=4058 RepID=A0ACC0CAM1_CATRO|nr:hypothetical protein M9H77_03071 [Catharanthus roseus]